MVIIKLNEEQADQWEAHLINSLEDFDPSLKMDRENLILLNEVRVGRDKRPYGFNSEGKLIEV